MSKRKWMRIVYHRLDLPGRSTSANMKRYSWVRICNHFHTNFHRPRQKLKLLLISFYFRWSLSVRKPRSVWCATISRFSRRTSVQYQQKNVLLELTFVARYTLNFVETYFYISHLWYEAEATNDLEANDAVRYLEEWVLNHWRQPVHVMFSLKF